MSFDTTRTPSFSDEKDVNETIDVVLDKLRALDVGLTLVADHSHDAPVPANESRRLCRKVDLHILPLLFLIYTGASL